MDGEFAWLARLSVDETFELRRARVHRTGAPVLVKTALPGSAPDAAATALRRECALAQQLSHAGELLPRIAEHAGSVALVMQDPGGVLLAQMLSSKCGSATLLEPPRGAGRAGPALGALDSGRLPTALALAVACQLAEGLAELHERGLVLNGVRPEAVLCDSRRARAWWVDVGKAYELADTATPGGRAAAPGPELDVAALLYAAPECTGRVDASADQRSDLYSLGVLLYQMLTGAPPYQSDDVLALIHLHVAGSAPPPAERRADVPEALSHVVMKLLAKAPDERYQSARGLLHDLAHCARVLERDGRIEPFALGRHDAPSRLAVAARLVGRDAEVQQLLRAFDAACDPRRHGTGALVLVEGHAGVGKTALIEQLYRPIARRRGRFISGKFDQVARGVPFGALVQAFSSLVHQALSDSEEQLLRLRSRLIDALGGNGGVLSEVIPELDLIVGPQSAPEPLSGAEAQNRFQRLMQGFVAALATPEQPLVLFLDDLQWADAATLGLLEPLLAGETRGLMLLGAYRDHELETAPRLVQALERLGGAGVDVQRIVLAPLGPAELVQLVAEALRSDSAYAERLAAMLFAKTGGNPLFAIQFLKALERDGHFRFDVDAGHWTYRIETIAQAPLADNVVDLMTQRIARLPSRAQYALTFAACMGNRFELATLAVVSEQAVEATSRDLELALAEGLIQRVAAGSDSADADASPRFGFVHDRVQQSAYSLIPPSRRAFVHRTVGRLLHARASTEQLDSELFDIVHHLNLGRELILERAERIAVAALNLAAGRRAKAATAHFSALELFEAGLALLDEAAWKGEPELSFELQFEAAQSRYLCGHFDVARERLLALRRRAHTRIERARIERQLSVQLENAGQYEAALATTREALKAFGIEFAAQEQAQAAALEREIASIDALRDGRPIATLVDLPELADAEIGMVMSMLTGVWSAAFIAGQATLARLFSATMVRLTLEHGHTPESAYGYVTHAITVGPVRGDYAAAYEYGTLALAVNARLDDKRLRAKIYQQFHAHVNLWCRPFGSCAGYARQAHASGLESGDFLYAAYALGTEPWSAFAAAQDLAQFDRDYSPNVAIVERLNNRAFADSLRLFVNWARALQGLTESPLSMTDASFDEAAYAETYDAHPFFGAIHSMLRLHLSLLLGTPAQAAQAARVAASRVHELPGTIWPVVERFWGALADAANCGDGDGGVADDADVARTLVRLRDAQAWFEALALHCEANFRCPALLLAGESARIEGRGRDALAHFEQALEVSSRMGQPRMQALAHELYARAQRALGHGHLARLHVEHAARAYARWGAHAKVQALAALEPAPVRRALTGDETAAPSDLGAFSAAPRGAAQGPDGLDLASVLKIGQAIASETQFDALLGRLLHLTIENAAAEFGHLVLEGEAGALVYSAAAADPSVHSVPCGAPLDECETVPHSIVHYVRRSGQALVLSREQLIERFAADPHIARHAPRCALCIPVRQHGRVAGVIYLEHRRIDSAFTAQRVRILESLATQAGIALENARLVTGLREQVAERERAQGQLAGALTEVQRLKDDLEAENSYLRRELIANVSHDLRTPLVAMRGYLEVLAAKGSVLGEEQRRNYLDIAVRQCAHLATLIDDLFELAKLDFKGVQINREAIQFADLTSDVLQKFQLVADQRGIGLHVDASGGLPLVNADLSLMERVLDNLIGNAITHTPEGGRVSVGLELQGSELKIEVVDTGEGIAPEQLPLIFNRFFRVDQARSSVNGTPGAGLGLAIAKRIVELHGGSIAVRSQPQQGTCFSFVLPLFQALSSA